MSLQTMVVHTVKGPMGIGAGAYEQNRVTLTGCKYVKPALPKTSSSVLFALILFQCCNVPKDTMSLILAKKTNFQANTTMNTQNQ